MHQSDRRIDWPGLMRAGLHGLSLHPQQFWALTPLELMMMLGRDKAHPSLSRTALEALMARFPDRTDTGGADDRS
jgi:uncharacterized phage protein (TIGR02216 family)